MGFNSAFKGLNLCSSENTFEYTNDETVIEKL